jgi:spore coat protein U-like protein
MSRNGLTVSVASKPSRRAGRTALRLALASLLAVAASAAQAGTASAGIAINLNVLSQSNCRFTSLPSTLMNFGVLDIASNAPISVSLPATMECKGSAPLATYAVTVGNGLYHDGSTRRLRHTAAPTNFLTYSATVAPAAGTVATNTPVNLTLTATIPVPSFQQAAVVLYSDTITITVQP